MSAAQATAKPAARPTCADAPSDAAPTGQALLDTAQAHQQMDLAAVLRTIASVHGKSPQQLLIEFAKLSFGPGKLSYEEYLALRLFDDKALAGADKAAFAGLDAARRTWVACNYREDWYGLMANKLAVTTLLGGYGFPVIPTLALVSDRLRLPGFPILAGREALAAFLRSSSDYPLFGKPFDAYRSLGSASLDAYDAASDSLVMPTGRAVPVDTFAAAVDQHYRSGYILQRRARPDAAVRAICGDRLATLRVMTAVAAGCAEVLRACWKIPAGGNVADNFWRPGNLLATVDLATGRVLRVVTGTGLAQREVTEHPDTGAPLIGIEVPGWQALTATACAAATALAEVPLIGWDMALTETGPLIVEPNHSPDFTLPQIADRRGMLDARMTAFIARCKAAKLAWHAAIKSKGATRPPEPGALRQQPRPGLNGVDRKGLPGQPSRRSHALVSE